MVVVVDDDADGGALLLSESAKSAYTETASISAFLSWMSHRHSDPSRWSTDSTRGLEGCTSI